MGYDPITANFIRDFRFVDDREQGDLVARSDIDTALDEITAAVNGALRNALNYVGDWSPLSGSFPTTRPDGSAIQARDAWSVTADGTVGGVAFSRDETLIALQNNPNAVYLNNWLRVKEVNPAAAYSPQFPDMASVQSAAVLSAIKEITVVSDTFPVRLQREPNGAVCVTSGDGQNWYAVQTDVIYPQHFSIGTFANVTAALASGFAMSASEKTAEIAKMTDFFGNTAGKKEIRGFVEVFDGITNNPASRVSLSRGVEYDGLVFSDRFNMSSQFTFRTSLPANGGGEIDSLHLIYDQSVAAASGDRADLVQYPPFSVAGDFGKIGHLRLTGSYDGFEAIGSGSLNNGGLNVELLEIGTLYRGGKIDGALHHVTIGTLDLWRYGIAGDPQLEAIADDGNVVLFEFGRIDTLSITNLNAFRSGALLFDTAHANPLQATITNCRLDADYSWLHLSRHNTAFGAIYGTETADSTHEPYKILVDEGSHDLGVVDLVGDADTQVKVEGGVVKISGKIHILNGDRRAIHVTGGRCEISDLEVRWADGNNTVIAPIYCSGGELVVGPNVRAHDGATTPIIMVHYGASGSGSVEALGGPAGHTVRTDPGSTVTLGRQFLPAGFALRSEFTAYVAAKDYFEVGSIISAGSRDYVKMPAGHLLFGSNPIPDLPGWAAHDYWTPEHNGATGTANDTAVVDAASAAAAAAGMDLVFEAKEYRGGFKARSYATWRGVIGKTILRVHESAGSQQSTVYHNVNTTDGQLIEFHAIGIIFHGSKSNGTGEAAFLVWGLQDCSFTDCIFRDAETYGFAAQARPGHAQSDTQDGLTMTRCGFINNGGTGSWDGCDIKYCTRMHFTDCWAFGNTNAGINVRGTGSFNGNRSYSNGRANFRFQANDLLAGHPSRFTGAGNFSGATTSDPTLQIQASAVNDTHVNLGFECAGAATSGCEISGAGKVYGVLTLNSHNNTTHGFHLTGDSCGRLVIYGLLEDNGGDGGLIAAAGQNVHFAGLAEGNAGTQWNDLGTNNHARTWP